MHKEPSWNRTWQALFAMILLAAGLRFYGLGNNSFVADEFLDINSSYGYAQTGQWKAWDFNYGKPAEMNANDARDERASVYKWQVAQLFKILPPTEAVARTVSVLWGIISVFIMFWTARYYTRSRSIGLIAAFLFAVSVPAIIFDRRLRMYAMFFPAYLAFVTSVFCLLEGKYGGNIAILKRWKDRFDVNIWEAPAVLALAAVSLAVHQLSAVAAFSVAAYLIARLIARYRTTGTMKNKYGAALAAGIAGFAILASAAPDSVRSFTAGLTFFDDHYSYLGYAFADYAHPLLAVALMAYGAYALSRTGDEGRKSAWWLSINFLVPLALAVWFFRRNAGPQYIFFAQSFGMILVAAGVRYLWLVSAERFSEWGRKGAYAALALMIILVPNWGYFFEENNTYHETSSGDQPDYRKTFAYVRKSLSEGDVLVTRNFRNYYWSGAEVPVYDFGGELSEERFSLAELERIMERHAHGWVVVSGNDYDYISKDAEAHWKEHMERVSNDKVRGDIEVYRW